MVAVLVVTPWSLSPTIEDGEWLDEGKSLERWDNFKKTFARSYSDRAEERNRFEIFRSNLERAHTMSAKDPSAEFGITKFSDKTPEEFRRWVGIGIETDPIVKAIERRNAPHGDAGTDWRGKAVTRVKNQGNCGSCWTFSAAGAMEACWHIRGHELVDLSTSQLLDCGPNFGCNGGDPALAITWVAMVGGIQSEETYPYQPVRRKCSSNSSLYVATSHSAIHVQLNNETALRQALIGAPVSVLIDSEPLQLYTGGVISDLCFSYGLNHAVLLVADVNHEYTLKNSWGTDFGEKGFFRMAWDRNCLGLALHPVLAC